MLLLIYHSAEDRREYLEALLRESKKEEAAPVLDDDSLNDLLARRFHLLLPSLASKYSFLGVTFIIIDDPMNLTWLTVLALFLVNLRLMFLNLLTSKGVTMRWFVFLSNHSKSLLCALRCRPSFINLIWVMLPLMLPGHMAENYPRDKGYIWILTHAFSSCDWGRLEGIL